MCIYCLEGPKWGSNVVSFSFAGSGGGNFSGSIDSADQAVIRRAMARWSSVANITFKEVSDGTPSTCIRFGWSQFGTGGQIGLTSYSYTSNSNTFTSGVTVGLEDPSQRALTGNANDPTWQGTTTSLYQVALHEIGHALGLAHSTDTNSVMYASSGLSNRDLDQTDIDGIQALYGCASATASQTNTPAATTNTAAINATTTGNSVYRFLNTTDGTHFFTGSDAEKASVIASRSDLKFEGAGMGATTASDPNAIAVYRFLDTAHGTHFYTASGAEKDSIIATRSDLNFEGVGFYEHANQQAGDTAVYRFLDTTNGTHFYSSSPAEMASITASRPDLLQEGIAFYAPK